MYIVIEGNFGTCIVKYSAIVQRNIFMTCITYDIFWNFISINIVQILVKFET